MDEIKTYFCVLDQATIDASWHGQTLPPEASVLILSFIL